MADNISNEEALLNIIIRIISLENLLITKNVVNKEEIKEEIKEVSNIVLKNISDKIVQESTQNNLLFNRKDSKAN